MSQRDRRVHTFIATSAIIVCWAVSIWTRLLYVSYSQVTSDTLSPFVGGVRWWNTGVFEPANPESDQWLWIVSFPLIALSDSLSGLFWWKCVASTILIPISMWLVARFVKDNQIFWMCVVAFVLTLDMGLIDTMLSSFRGYWAPECMALACVGLYNWDQERVWGAHLTTIVVVIAMGQHPLALGCIPALGWLYFSMWKRGERWWISVLLALVCLTPRMIWLWDLMQCDAGGIQCLTTVAVSSSEEASYWSLLIRVVIDRLWIEMGLASILMILGWRKSSNSTLQMWLIWSGLGIAILGLSISTLRPYHFRVLIVPMIVLAIQGLSRFNRLGMLLGSCWCAAVCIYRIEPVSWYNTAPKADTIASMLCMESEPVWLEGYGENLQVSPQSVGLSLFLQECVAPISHIPTEEIWVIEDIQGRELLQGQVVWQDSSTQLKKVARPEWQNMVDDQQWSGHDVAVLFWDPERIHLE